MMSLRRLSIGAGYKYLMQSIASGDGRHYGGHADLEAYYHATGTPPGRFLGRGLVALNHGDGVEPGTVVQDEHLRRMMKELADPITGEPLSARKLRDNSVGSFDLTFSPPKSVSVVWALATPDIRKMIYECHTQALEEVLAYAEEHVFRVRAGHDGLVVDATKGVVAAAFTHFDSRAGDPQLHDHVVVLNRAISARDGHWRALDSRAIFASAVELSELHHGLLMDRLSEKVGLGWASLERRYSTAPKWEVEGVAPDLMSAFSTRSADIEEEKNRLILQFEDDHHRAPTDVEVIRLRQAATLATRPAKQHHSLESLIGEWRERARSILAIERAELDAYVPHLVTWPERVGADAFTDDVLEQLAGEALERVSSKRATFSNSNLRAEVGRLLHGTRFLAHEDREGVTRRVAELAANRAVLLNTPDLRSVPALLTRENGTSAFHDTAHYLYSSRLILEAEGRLLDASQMLTAPALSRELADAAIAAPLPGRALLLSADQAAAVAAVATSGRQLDLLVGPAGSGKSTAMAGLRVVWESQFGPGTVLGLAPSAAAAEVLGDELAIDTENVSKFLTEYRLRGERRRKLATLHTQMNSRYASGLAPTTRQVERVNSLEQALLKWQLHENQLVIVDEASMLATFDFDELASAVADAGAKLLAVGDYAQLASVDAGGMFSTLVDSRHDVATLDTIQRFGEAWEAKASLLVRAGDDTAFFAYSRHDRFREGGREDLVEAVYQSWLEDQRRGRTSLMMARDNATVTTLNARARVERIARGEVVGECRVATGYAGVGDLVVTRRNDRSLVDEAGNWVRNGNAWHVEAIAENGSLVLRRPGTESTVTAPPSYVRQYVELGYASTLHRSQGRTVDRAHCLVDPGTDRESLYVGLTRGRESNTLYVDTEWNIDPDTAHPGVHVPTDLRGTFRAMLANYQKKRSATDIMRSAADEQGSVRRLVAEYESIVTLSDTTEWAEVLEDTLADHDLVTDLVGSDGFEMLSANLRHTRALGYSLDEVLPDLVEPTLADAKDVATVLDYRLRRWLDAAPEIEGARYVAGLFPVAEVDDRGTDVEEALDERRRAIEDRCLYLIETAFENAEPWTEELGAPPLGADFLSWRDAAVTVAAYRERWGITTGVDVLGEIPRHDCEQRVQRDRAIDALRVLDELADSTQEYQGDGREQGLSGLSSLRAFGGIGSGRDDLPPLPEPWPGGPELGL